ncbi:MAG: hypothetical protein HQK65_06230 [Desulfamplus sp.]|nr:hypothetical protein [Desulfamplus sp.]
MSSFKTCARFEQAISGIKAVHLSLCQYKTFPKKDLLSVGGHQAAKHDRKTFLEHLSDLVVSGRLKDAKCPLMVLSVRNVLANYRGIGYVPGRYETPLAVAGEQELLPECRPYHILGEKNGQLVIETWDPAGETWGWDSAVAAKGQSGQTFEKDKCPYSWFISGIPVVWDDIDADGLYKMIITEAADHSHVWRLPRGSHPEATDWSKAVWKTLETVFLKHLTSSMDEAHAELDHIAQLNNLTREDGYFHNIIGIDQNGHLCQLINTGRIEELGQQIKARGVKRAIIVDNSGSTTVKFLPNGLAGALANEIRHLVAAPNHRQPGTAYLVIELADSSFESLQHHDIIMQGRKIT